MRIFFSKTETVANMYNQVITFQQRRNSHFSHRKQAFSLDKRHYFAIKLLFQNNLKNKTFSLQN